MDEREEDRDVRGQEMAPLQERSRKPGVLPCGSRGCMYCHNGCRVDSDRAAFLSELEENEQSGRASQASSTKQVDERSLPPEQMWIEPGMDYTLD